MLNDVDVEILCNEVIWLIIISGVDVIFVFIDDGFVVSVWKELVSEYLLGVNQYEVFCKIIIDCVVDDYDFILIDIGLYFDLFLLNGLVVSDFIFIFILLV